MAGSTGDAATGDEDVTDIGADFGTGEEVSRRVAFGADGSVGDAAGSGVVVVA